MKLEDTIYEALDTAWDNACDAVGPDIQAMLEKWGQRWESEMRSLLNEAGVPEEQIEKEVRKAAEGFARACPTWFCAVGDNPTRFDIRVGETRIRVAVRVSTEEG